MKAFHNEVQDARDSFIKPDSVQSPLHGHCGNWVGALAQPPQRRASRNRAHCELLSQTTPPPPHSFLLADNDDERPSEQLLLRCAVIATTKLVRRQAVAVPGSCSLRSCTDQEGGAAHPTPLGHSRTNFRRQLDSFPPSCAPDAGHSDQVKSDSIHEEDGFDRIACDSDTSRRMQILP